jgi:3-oxoacyl-[acyl-carrier-protein] synthase-3
MPATSFLLQDRLGLKNSCIAFDVNIGCSGFIYGLSVIYGLMQNAGINKAMLLDGETRSKVYSPKDRNTAFIFGDAGTATLIERKAEFGDSFFSLNSDGSRAHLIKINAGGYRNPSSIETLKEKVVDEYGNIRSDEHGYMLGGDVFNFVVREVPVDFKNTLNFARIEKEEIDFFVFHQANKFINDFLAKKLKIPFEKIPSTISKFGNTSSVSIPLTMISELKEELNTPKTILLSAFGVGLSWATAIIHTHECIVSSIVEV